MADDIVVDLTNFKDRVGSRVHPGRYLVVVEDAEQDKARSGNTMINVWLRIVGGDFDGSTIIDRLVLTERSLFRVVGFMQAIGLPTPKKRLALKLTQIIGRKLEVDVEDGEPYQGRVKSEIRGYNRIAKDNQETADEVDLDDLEAGAGASSDEGNTPINGDADEVPEADADAVDETGEEPAEPAKPTKAKTTRAKKTEDDQALDLDSVDLG